MTFIFRIIFMLAALGGVLYAIYKLNTEGIDPSIFHLDANQSQSFDIQKVTHFEWQSQDKLFAYDRDSKGDWLPKKHAKNLNDLLTFLSQIQLNQVEQKGKSYLDVAIDVDGIRWAGTWDGLSFVWKSGPNAGKGEILAERKNKTFFKGRHVFETVEINLCKNRIKKIFFSFDGANYVIEQVQSGWAVTSPVTKKLDAIVIERWLIGLCNVTVKSIIDTAYAQSNKAATAVDFEFIDGQRDSFFQLEHELFLHQKVGLILEGLSQALEELKKEVLSPGKP